MISPSNKIKVLIVDDEVDVLEFLKYNLEREGYEVQTAHNGLEAIDAAQQYIPDLIILDVMMPQMDGIEACRELRQIRDLQNTIITFLTARHEDYSQIAAFDVGADDYIPKPVKPRLLVKKVQSLLRRLQNGNSMESIEANGITIDTEKRLVTYKAKVYSLPKKEYRLLRLLMSKPGRVFTREEILAQVWGTDTIVVDRTIDVHIRKLREKFNPDLFLTIKGVGYKFGN